MEVIFLLGGYDLEMEAIKELLNERDIQYFDRHLAWDNAFLWQYEDILKRYGNRADCIVYGIELIEKGAEDIPVNYFRIDHHNDLNRLPSALEQTAEILNVSLSRRQQLIAANDKAYIPGMVLLGATREEIEEIRRSDREAQGVTKQDEELAEKAIEKRKTENGITIVQSGTSRFSPITDRLYPYGKLLIYTDDELMYYGIGKKLLVDHFVKEINSKKMFHGGDDNGFIGTAQNVYSEKELEELKDKIIKLLKS